MKKFYPWPTKKENSPEPFKAPSFLRVPGPFWMADLKKAGDRAACLFSRDRKRPDH